MKKLILYFWEIFKVVVISLAIIIPVRYYLIQPFFVRGVSMEPNFNDGQYLVIDEISYRLNKPQRGQVVVFKYPIDPSQYYIKRIVGLPNETVEVKGGKVYIYNLENPQGMILGENYLFDKTITQGDVTVKLDNGQYFVMGDNRTASSDSRQWGFLPEKNIVGRVWLRAWPLNLAKIF